MAGHPRQRSFQENNVNSSDMTTNSVVEQLEQLKADGNKAFADKDYKTSVARFTEAIGVDPTNAVFLSNRSAAFACLQRWEEALEDADKAVELKPDWSKGYGRRGAALQGMHRYAEALEAYSDGLKLDPENQQLLKGKEACESKLEEEPGDEGAGMFAKVLNDPNFISKLAANPRTAQYLSDPSFRSVLAELQRNPSAGVLGKDQRILEAILVAMGMNVDFKSPSDFKKDVPETGSVRREEPREQPKREEKEESPAESEKALGNSAYKRKDFETAMQHYKKAGELEPSNMSYLLNQSAVLFELSDFSECIATCERAIEVGREHKADFKQIARAFLRIANSHHKLGDLDAAIRFYSKSLTEHRTPEALERLRAVEKERSVKAKAAYRDADKAEEERNAGNELFKAGKFAEAVKHYSEAIRRDENDPRAYSNRAACYTKLAAVPEGLKDCEKAIQLEPSFVKAYIRKAVLLIMKKDWSGAEEACDQAEAADKEKKHTKEIADLRYKARSEQLSDRPASEEEIKKRAMQNPDVMEILSDPAMQAILQQMQTDPRAAMDHLKNPMVASKIRKLIDAGIIRTG